MACTNVTTGQGFLEETLSHLDCQAQSIGSFGYGALVDASSPASTVLLALLTLFIALFGVRLLFAGQVGTRDAVGAILKIGIVLTFAASWPAFRTIAYDTVLYGPPEIAAAIGNENLPDMQGGLAGRLQGIDDGITALTMAGTGRQTGSLDVPGEQRSSFTGIAMVDESGFGWGRTLFLGSTIGPLAALRIAAGVLLAIAPLVAGFLLFDLTRGIFSGWLRGLLLTALGSLGVTLLLAVQVAVMEPWMADVLNRRTLGYATPGAATELLALSLGFAIASFGLLAILTRVAFQNGWPMSDWFRSLPAASEYRESAREKIRQSRSTIPVHSRALAVSDGIRATMRHETGRSERVEERRISEAVARSHTTSEYNTQGAGRREALGSTYRRTARRTTGAERRRDRTT